MTACNSLVLLSFVVVVKDDIHSDVLVTVQDTAAIH